VSRAPLAKLQAYKRRMGWTFPWASWFGDDRAPRGRNETGVWWRRHDEYDKR
jgi:predicted dithiol-disulfide oxidoreductase (DUF899 family)